MLLYIVAPLFGQEGDPDSQTDPFQIAVLRARGLIRGLTPEEQAAYLEQRGARSAKGRFVELLEKAGSSDTVLPGDEIPEGWLPEQDQRSGS